MKKFKTHIVLLFVVALMFTAMPTVYASGSIPKPKVKISKVADSYNERNGTYLYKITWDPVKQANRGYSIGRIGSGESLSSTKYRSAEWRCKPERTQ